MSRSRTVPPRFPFVTRRLRPRIVVAGSVLATSSMSSLIEIDDAARVALRSATADIEFAEQRLTNLRAELAQAVLHRDRAREVFAHACRAFALRVGQLARGDAAAIASAGLVKRRKPRRPSRR